MAYADINGRRDDGGSLIHRQVSPGPYSLRHDALAPAAALTGSDDGSKRDRKSVANSPALKSGSSRIFKCNGMLV